MSERFKEAFDTVHADEALKNRTKAFIHEKARENSRVPLLKLAGSFAVLTLVFFGSFTFFRPVHALSMDVNPSVELGINCYDRVVRVRSWNEEGKALEKVSGVRYRSYTDAVVTLVESEALEPYIQEAEPVTVTVLGASPGKSEEMALKLTEAESREPGKLSVRQGDPQQLDQAHAMGLSFGKYQSYLELKALKPDVTVEEIRDMPMCRIRAWIESLRAPEMPAAPVETLPDVAEKPEESCGRDAPGGCREDQAGPGGNCRKEEDRGGCPQDPENQGGCRQGGEEPQETEAVPEAQIPQDHSGGCRQPDPEQAPEDSGADDPSGGCGNGRGGGCGNGGGHRGGRKGR